MYGGENIGSNSTGIPYKPINNNTTKQIKFNGIKNNNVPMYYSTDSKPVCVKISQVLFRNNILFYSIPTTINKFYYFY